MASESQFLRTVMPHIPTGIAKQIRTLCNSSVNNEIMLENFMRFLVGAEHAPDAPKDVHEKWPEKQLAMKNALEGLLPAQQQQNGSGKRSRQDTEEGAELEGDAQQQQSKRARLDVTSPTGTKTNNASTTTTVDNGLPIFTLHAISTTSPIRKKVDITVHQNAVVMSNPTTHSVEATIPLGSLRRSFIVPTRGKTKPHWTVIILSSDIPDNPKIKSQPGHTSTENIQIIFGSDATTSTPFTLTTFDPTGLPTQTVLPRNTPILPQLHVFLSHLTNVPIVELSSNPVFKSSCPGIGANASGSSGIPGVEAYLRAKQGNLWFSDKGILWGESKPCEFWAVEDLHSKDQGVRLVGGGRTCSVVLTRVCRSSAKEEGDSLGEGEEEHDNDDQGEETEFGMIDGKERENINQWVRSYRHLFGSNAPVPSSTSPSEARKNDGGESQSQSKPLKPAYAGPLTIHTMQDLSDDEDDDFDANVSDLDGSESLSDEERSSTDGDNDDDNNSENGESDAEGDRESDSDIEELDPVHHPLLRPGATPRMSKAAMDMAVGIVEGVLSGQGGGTEEQDELEDEEEEDELED